MSIQCLRSARAPAVAGLFALAFFLLPHFDPLSRPSAGGKSPIDLTELSLEDLLSIEVTSVSKKTEKLSETSAAAYVITAEDIRRSGARSIPEVLRQVPGLQVSRISSNAWAVSVRGFAAEFSNKLLVMIDGRSIYSPLYSGVFWDSHDMLLEDIEQIEVIRGPGATIWGANAVNGVINIITKNTEKTQGVMLLAGGGSAENGFSAVRYGNDLGNGITYRAYGKYFERNEFARDESDGTWDGWNLGFGGIRVDRKTPDGGSFMLTVDGYDGQNAQMVTTTSFDPLVTITEHSIGSMSGGSAMARWSRPTGDLSSWTLQLFGDRSNAVILQTGELRHTADLDFNHNFQIGTRHQMTWGMGYRITEDEIVNSSGFSFDPSSKTDHLYSAFLQDDSWFVDNRLRLTLGSKFEHNSYTGFEYQPNARLSWKSSSRSNVWCAVSRAVRTPSRAEATFSSNLYAAPGTAETGGLPLLFTLFGNDSLEAEDLLALELGFRSHLVARFAFDVSLFYHDFKNIISMGAGTPYTEPAGGVPSYLVIPSILGNGAGSIAKGVETAITWDPAQWWMLNAGYTYLNVHNKEEAAIDDELELIAYSQHPEHQVDISSRFDLPGDLELDLFASLVDKLEGSNIPSYAKLDVRIGWQPVEHLEVSAAVLDLLDESHPEFAPWTSEAIEVERRYYGKLTWTY